MSNVAEMVDVDVPGVVNGKRFKHAVPWVMFGVEKKMQAIKAVFV